MLKYTIKRLLQSLFTVFLIVTLIFILMRMLPADRYFSEDEMMHLSKEQQEAILNEAGLLDPIPKQLIHFYGDVLKFDFGVSRRIQPGKPVVELIEEKFTVSMRNGAMALGIALAAGILMGVAQTLNKNGIIDHLGTAFTIFINSVPAIVSFSLIMVFGSKVLDLPTLYSSRRVGLSNVMPVVCLSLSSIAGYALWTRRYMVDELNKDYIKLAKIKGLSRSKIMFKHVLKNAFVPLAQYLPSAFLATIAGSMLVETFFSVPGMGPVLTKGVTMYDVSVVQVLSILYATLGVLGAFLGDLLMMLFDPRITLLEKEETR